MRTLKVKCGLTQLLIAKTLRDGKNKTNLKALITMQSSRQKKRVNSHSIFESVQRNWQFENNWPLVFGGLSLALGGQSIQKGDHDEK